MFTEDTCAMVFQQVPAPPISILQNDSGCASNDDSLTDIRWLGTMDAAANFPSLERVDRRLRAFNKDLKHQHQKGKICKRLNYGPGKKEDKSDAHKLRPPFSYAALIALAINSNHQKMLTLNSIYQWIETNFPFFRMPEAKAWKNSIRHNLSIKKTMFQKVYLNPPRRGNGAYWTLLMDGQEEVERCIKLFHTLRPPVLDEQSIYNQLGSSSSHVVRSTGQFIPAQAKKSCSHPSLTVEVTTDDRNNTSFSVGESENTTEAEASPHIPATRYFTTYPRAYPPSIQPYNPAGIPSSSQVTPIPISTKPENRSINLLDTSFLTPLKDDFMQEIDLNTISFSPSMFNFLTPRGANSNQATPFRSHVIPTIVTPQKPTHQGIPEVDSGVFSPLHIRYSTPLKGFSSFPELVHPHGFSTPNKDVCMGLPAGETGSTPSRAVKDFSGINRSLLNILSTSFDGQTPLKPLSEQTP